MSQKELGPSTPSDGPRTSGEGTTAIPELNTIRKSKLLALVPRCALILRKELLFFPAASDIRGALPPQSQEHSSPPPWCFCLCPPGHPPPAHPWRSPSEHPAPLETPPDLVPSGSPLLQSLCPWPTASQTPRLPCPPSTGCPRPQLCLLPDALGPQTLAPALQQGPTPSGWRFSTSQAPNCQGSAQASRVARFHAEPSPSRGLYPHPHLPRLTHFLSSPRPLTRKGLGVFARTQACIFPP